MRLIDADHLRRWILSRVFKTQLSVADVIDQIDREDTIELQPEVRTFMSSADCISRAAAIEAVYKNDRYTTIKQRLDTLPPAQPEIIRCKNCKHRHLDGMIWNCPFGLSGGEDFFCAYGAKDGDSDDE